MEEKENSHVRKIGQKSCAGSEKRSSAFNTFFLFLLMGICINDVYFLFCWMREGKGCVFGRGEKTWMEFQLENILEYVCEKIYYAFFYDGIFSFFLICWRRFYMYIYYTNLVVTMAMGKSGTNRTFLIQNTHNLIQMGSLNLLN